MILRVLIVSDVRLIQEALQSVLERQVGTASISTSDVPHAMEHCDWVDPDAILLDAAHHGTREQLRRLVASAPRAKIVAFGAQESDEKALAPAAPGAMCCVRAGAASAELVRVLEGITSREQPSLPDVGASPCRQALRAPGASGRPLSRRELQIARQIDRGLSNKEIARELGIETATVKNHVHNLCEKLSVHRRGQATARIRAMLGARAGPALLPSANAAHGSG
jgi:two-component system, NarL family, nitrate/nitrite response regulator NarL